MILVKNLKFLYLHSSRPNWSKRMFSDILYTKKTCFYATNKLIIGSWKISIFCKGVSPSFWSKIWSFLPFTFLGQIDQKECLAMFLIENFLFYPQKNIDIRKLQSLHFYKVVNAHFWLKIWGFLTSFFWFKLLKKSVKRRSWHKKPFVAYK